MCAGEGGGGAGSSYAKIRGPSCRCAYGPLRMIRTSHLLLRAVALVTNARKMRNLSPLVPQGGGGAGDADGCGDREGSGTAAYEARSPCACGGVRPGRRWLRRHGRPWTVAESRARGWPGPSMCEVGRYAPFQLLKLVQQGVDGLDSQLARGGAAVLQDLEHHRAKVPGVLCAPGGVRRFRLPVCAVRCVSGRSLQRRTCIHS